MLKWWGGVEDLCVAGRRCGRWCTAALKSQPLPGCSSRQKGLSGQRGIPPEKASCGHWRQTQWVLLVLPLRTVYSYYSKVKSLIYFNWHFKSGWLSILSTWKQHQLVSMYDIIMMTFAMMTVMEDTHRKYLVFFLNTVLTLHKLLFWNEKTLFGLENRHFSVLINQYWHCITSQIILLFVCSKTLQLSIKITVDCILIFVRWAVKVLSVFYCGTLWLQRL